MWFNSQKLEDMYTILVLYGFGDHLSFVTNDSEAGAPFKSTIWGKAKM